MPGRALWGFGQVGVQFLSLVRATRACGWGALVRLRAAAAIFGLAGAQKGLKGSGFRVAEPGSAGAQAGLGVRFRLTG